MFKFETLVYVVLVSFGSVGFATNSERTNGGLLENLLAGQSSDCKVYADAQAEAYNALRTARAAGRGIEAADREHKRAQEEFKRCKSDSRGGGANASADCEDAVKDYDVANPAFSAACQALGISNGAPDAPAGAIACSWQKERCNCVDSKFEDTDDKLKCSAVRADTGTGNGRNRSNNGLIDLKNARNKMKWCPDKDPDDIERYEKQLEKSQERIRELKKKLPDTLNKGNEAQDKASQAQNDAYRKGAEAQKEFANELKEIKKQREGEEQQAVAEMASMREKIDQIDAQIRNIELEKVNAEVKLGDTKIELELQCHAQASKQVSDLQTQKMSSINGRQSQGSFNALLTNVGLSSRAAWEKKADYYYRKCIASRPHREMKKRAQNNYESSLRGYDATILSLRTQRKSAEQSLSQVMSKNGCAAPQMQANGMTGETKLCRSLRSAQENMAQAAQDAQNKQNVIQQEMVTAQRQLAQKNQTLQLEYADQQQELNDEQRRMENLRAYLDLKREFSLGAGTKEAAKELATNSSKLKASAIRIDSCCVKGQIASNNPKCKEVSDFIKSFGGSPAVRTPELDSNVDEPSTPRRAPEAPGRAIETPAESQGLIERGSGDR